MKATQRTCTVADCDRTATTKNMCPRHYTRMHNNGTTEPVGYLGMARSLTIEQRLEHFSETSGDCLIWTGSTDRDGYGQTRFRGGRRRRTHRIAWELAHGPIPDGMVVRHKCDNPPCMKLDHLELGSVAQNNADRRQRGRSTRGTSHHARRLAENDVRQIRTRLAEGHTQAAIARDFGVSTSAIDAIKSGKTWGWLK